METKSVVIEMIKLQHCRNKIYIGVYLFNYKKNCVVIRESISSLSTFNSVAESYNFGSDFTKNK